VAIVVVVILAIFIMGSMLLVWGYGGEACTTNILPDKDDKDYYEHYPNYYPPIPPAIGSILLVWGYGGESCITEVLVV
jgi:hypothetical protein